MRVAVIATPRQGPGRRGSGTKKERRKYPVRHYQAENEKKSISHILSWIYYLLYIILNGLGSQRKKQNSGEVYVQTK